MRQLVLARQSVEPKFNSLICSLGEEAGHSPEHPEADRVFWPIKRSVHAPIVCRHLKHNTSSGTKPYHTIADCDEPITCGRPSEHSRSKSFGSSAGQVPLKLVVLPAKKKKTARGDTWYAEPEAAAIGRE